MLSLDLTYFLNFQNKLEINKSTFNLLARQKIKKAFLHILDKTADKNTSQVIFFLARYYHKHYHYSVASKLYSLLIKNYTDFSFCYFYLALISEANSDFKKTSSYFESFFLKNENYFVRSYYLSHILKCPKTDSRKLLLNFKSFSKLNKLNYGKFNYSSSSQKIKVGYICSFWKSPTCRSQLLPFIKCHDKSKFEILGYGSHSDFHIDNHFESFTVIHNRSETDIINKLRNDKLDIIIECSGFSPYNSLLQLSARCAPVQICYMNHTSTTGLQNIDYILADEISILPHEEKFFTEKIIRKDGCFFCFDFREQRFPNITDSPCMRNGHITFGFLGGHTVKINDKMVETWSRIIQEIPNSKLLIINNELKSISVLRNFKKKFAKYGIGEHSLDLRPGVSRDEILQCYNEIDISFDTWPYCGGNTLAESLWMGVPCVSLLGERFSSRYGSSILNACDLDFLIVETFDEYIEKCRELASKFDKLNSLRTTMRERINNSGFNDSQSFAKSLEDIFSNLVNKVSEDA